MKITYQNLIETINIVSKYNGGLDAKCTDVYASDNELAFEFKEEPSAEDLRKLSKMGWKNCYSKKEEKQWENCDQLTDEELLDLFSLTNMIFVKT